MAKGKPGRPPIGRKAMTAAQRKARSRLMQMAVLVGTLDLAAQALKVVQAEAIRMSPEMADALTDLDVHLATARKLVPSH